MAANRIVRALELIAISVLILWLFGCASPTARIDAAAARAGMTREVVQGTSFRHVVYTRASTAHDPTWTIYLESDGLPWIEGRVPADDPTTRAALSLELMSRADQQAMYVSRPCYQELADAACSWQLWTMARYSQAVVDSMATAIASTLRRFGATRVRLIGYSGGGALAVLIAERLDNVAAVITISANLDTDAWTTRHGYLPLTDSLNPARSRAPHPWKELHLQGAKDDVVPPATTRAYFERYPSARRITLPDYGHVCCWVRDWPELLARIHEKEE